MNKKFTGLGWIGWSVFSLIGLFVLFGAYFYMYVVDRTDQLNEYYFRVLSVTGNNLEEAMDGLRINVENAANARVGGIEGDTVNTYNALRLIPAFPNIQSIQYDTIQDSDEPQVKWILSGTDLVMSTTNPDSIQIIEDTVIYDRTIQYSGSVNYDVLFKGIYPTSEFEGVMILRKDGTVIHGENDGTLQVASFPITSLTNAANTDSEVNSSNQIAHHTQIFEIPIATSLYKVFIQPIDLPLELHSEDQTAADADTDGMQSETGWILAGLKKSTSFRSETMSISPAKVLGVLGLLAISILAMPFLKLQFIGIREKVHKHDILVVAITMLMISSIITMALLNYSMKKQFKSIRDENLKQIAVNIEQSFRQELDSLDKQIQSLTYRYLDHTNLVSGANPQAIETRTKILQEGSEPLEAYPLLEMVYWIREDGRQQAKWSVKNRITPLIDLSERDYFKYAKAGELWQSHRAGIESNYSGLREVNILPGRYVQSIRSRTTGQIFTTLSKRVKIQGIPDSDSTIVVAAAISPMMSVIKPVMPPGYIFCIVDSHGKVLFHSSNAHNLRENFFDEVSKEESVKSMIQFRKSDYLNLDYHTNSFRFYAVPIVETPWSLLVLNENGPLRMLHVEIPSFTLLLCVTYTISLILVFLGFYWFSSRFKMGGEYTTLHWLWPDERKLDRYAFVLLGCIFIIAGWSLLMILWNPLVSLVFSVSYAFLGIIYAFLILLQDRRLTPKGKKSTYSIVIFSGAMILLIAWTSIDLIIKAEESQYRNSILFISAVLIMGLFLMWQYTPHIKKFLQNWLGRYLELNSRRITWKVPLFTTSALALIVVLGILPIISIYRAVHDEFKELYVKRQQLSFAERLQDRATRVFERYQEVDLSKYHSEQICHYFFPKHNLASKDGMGATDLNKAWDIHALSDSDATPVFIKAVEESYGTGHRNNTVETLSPKAATEPLVATFKDLLPGFNLFSEELRNITTTQTHDSLWTWSLSGPVKCSNNEDLKFASLKLFYDNYRFHKNFDKNVELSEAGMKTGLWVTSPVHYFQVDRPLIWLLTSLMILIVLWILIRLVLYRVFLVKMTLPNFLSPNGISYSGICSHRLILRDPPAINSPKGHQYYLNTSKPFVNSYSLRKIIGEVERSDANTIMVDNFHDGLWSPEIAAKKLDLIENLVSYAEGSRKIHEKEICIDLYSDINPLHFFRMLSGDYHRNATKVKPDLDRWSAVLEKFVRIRKCLQSEKGYQDELLEKLAEQENPEEIKKWEDLDPKMSENLEILVQECWMDPYLQKIGLTLARHPDIKKLEPKEVISQVLDLAEDYYQRLWAISGKDEKMILYRLSQEKLIGWPSRELLRRLMHRCLVKAVPEFKPMNESFRKFVLQAELPEVFDSWEKEAGASNWARLKLPLLVVMGGLLIFLITTQQERLQETLSVAAALAAAAPALTKVIAMMLQTHKGGVPEI